MGDGRWGLYFVEHRAGPGLHVLVEVPGSHGRA